MATKKKPSHRVMERMLQEPHQFDFFQAVMLLERQYGDQKRNDVYTDNEAHPVFIQPHTGLVFPPSDVKNIEITQRHGHSMPEVTVTFMGLYGIASPLPVYFYDEIATDQAYTLPLKTFLDFFNHRLYQHFFRAWKKYQPSLQAQNEHVDRHAERFFALAGIGLPDQRSGHFFSPMRLAAFAGRLSSPTRNVEGLRALLEAFFDDTKVKIQENIPRWVELSERPIMSRKSRNGMLLGNNITLGRKLFDISGKFRIHMQIRSLEQYLGLLPGGRYEAMIRYLVGLYAPDGLSYDIQLEIPANLLPRQSLGKDKPIRLGLTGMLGHAKEALHKRIIQYF
ncbi:MAG TPA: type VI secretion system baseplate subunit TssG [Bacteroidetes bacterium]|nr:type VI secretion system baseplate subunit TssG [Bacteroidota bacterium]HRR07124.1 type VI secretion system baseplate subunit TssG [Rhodothermales bacterium]